MLHTQSHMVKTPSITHPATFAGPESLISPGSRLAQGTAWTTGVDRHEVITTRGGAIKTDAANGRFVIDVGDATNLGLAFNFDKASDPAAETAPLDLWFGRPYNFNGDGGYEVDLEWQGLYTLVCATSGSGLTVPTNSVHNPSQSAYMKWADDISDAGGNAYAFTTRIRRVNSGRASRVWDLAGHGIVVGQVYPASGVTIGGAWWKF